MLSAINTCEPVKEKQQRQTSTEAAKPQSDYVSSIAVQEEILEEPNSNLNKNDEQLKESSNMDSTPQPPKLPLTQPTESFQDLNKLRSQLTNLKDSP